jgi:hypothetical protein
MRMHFKVMTKIGNRSFKNVDSMDKQPKQQEIGMRFGMWNGRSLYRTGSLVAVSKGIIRI